MKKSSKKGLKIAAITVGCIALAVAAGFGTYRIKNRIDSKKYNLITLDTSSLPAPQEPVRDGFAQLKNVRMHYVVYGNGEQPLVLIHGNGGSAKSLAEAASYLANDYTVYVIESRCHGQSSDPGTIDYESMADDTAQFIAAMKQIARTAGQAPDELHQCPQTTPVGRLDEVSAARHPKLR